jgi:hypothetical protein
MWGRKKRIQLGKSPFDLSFNPIKRTPAEFDEFFDFLYQRKGWGRANLNN